MGEALYSLFSFFLMRENEKKKEFEQLDVKQGTGNYLWMNIN